MKDFKLIAIRPLTGCDKKFTKILSEGVTYVFYNEYDFSKYTDQARIIKQKENTTPDLFSVKNNFKKEVNINISAIVGENGSGKSSIVELFYVSCYNISVINEVLYDEDEERLLNSKDIVPDINVEIFYKIDAEVFLLKLNKSEIKIFNLQKDAFVELRNHTFSLSNFFYTISLTT